MLLSKSSRIVLLLVVVTCMALGFACITAEAQDSPCLSCLPAPRATSGARHNDITSATAIVYGQPPSPSGGLYQSSRNGTDYDQYVWDNFTIQSSQAITITEIQWRGGYDPARFGSGGRVTDFIVAIYPSMAAGTQPDVTNPPLVQYQTGGNAGETPAGTYGGVAMYDYGFILPAPFQATGGTKYWVQIEAPQGGIPDWGIAAGTGGDGKYFLGFAATGDIYYQIAPGDAAFTLLGPSPLARRAYLPLILPLAGR